MWVQEAERSPPYTSKRPSVFTDRHLSRTIIMDKSSDSVGVTRRRLLIVDSNIKLTFVMAFDVPRALLFEPLICPHTFLVQNSSTESVKLELSDPTVVCASHLAKHTAALPHQHLRI